MSTTISGRTVSPNKAPLTAQAVGKPVVRSVSAAEVLAAGGATKYARAKGVNPKTAKISGLVRLSREEADQLQTELRSQQ
jgi:hypothetical protein